MWKLKNLFRDGEKGKEFSKEGRGDAADPAEQFFEEYETEEQELTVLIKEFTKGGAVRGDYLFPVVSFLAYIDRESGKVVHEKGALCWVIHRSSGDYIHKFKDYEIYNVLVRKMKPGILNPVGQPFKNRYYVVKVLKRKVKEPQLERVRTEYLKPISIKDSLGEFKLDRKYDRFEGQIDWMGSMEDVSLKKDEDADTANLALKTLHMLTSETAKWDGRLREYAAGELTELANDWREDEDISDITREEFAERIGSPSFFIDNRGDFEAVYGDDDMFAGHWIVVYGTADGRLTDTGIEG